MPNKLKDVIHRAETWPEEDQAELAEYAREIEAERNGVYALTDDERLGVNEGLAQARRGEFVADAEMKVFWERHRIA